MTRFDLHIHTALSGCAENVMSPRQILKRVKRAGLNLVALTDHNASDHVIMAQNIAEELELILIPGIEVTSAEEVHVLTFFEGKDALQDFQLLLDAALPNERNVAEVFGDQVIFDEHDNVVRLDEQLRQVGTTLTLELLVKEVRSRGGAVVPAHIFRPRFSLTSQLGFIDPDSDFDLVEVAAARWQRQGLAPGQGVQGYPAVSGSDAHCLDDVGRVKMVIEPDVRGLRALVQALQSGCEK